MVIKIAVGKSILPQLKLAGNIRFGNVILLKQSLTCSMYIHLSSVRAYTQKVCVINLTINLISKGKYFSFVFHIILYVIVCNVKCLEKYEDGYYSVVRIVYTNALIFELVFFMIPFLIHTQRHKEAHKGKINLCVGHWLQNLWT